MASSIIFIISWPPAARREPPRQTPASILRAHQAPAHARIIWSALLQSIQNRQFAFQLSQSLQQPSLHTSQSLPFHFPLWHYLSNLWRPLSRQRDTWLAIVCHHPRMNHAFPICCVTQGARQIYVCRASPCHANYIRINLWLSSFKYEICCYFYDYLYYIDDMRVINIYLYSSICLSAP